jgi:PRTRC genetic system protein C
LDRKLSPEEIKAAYSNQYPELATAAINGPEAVGDKLRYEFVRAIGAKG